MNRSSTVSERRVVSYCSSFIKVRGEPLIEGTVCRRGLLGDSCCLKRSVITKGLRYSRNGRTPNYEGTGSRRKWPRTHRTRKHVPSPAGKKEQSTHHRGRWTFPPLQSVTTPVDTPPEDRLRPVDDGTTRTRPPCGEEEDKPHKRLGKGLRSRTTWVSFLTHSPSWFR